jgi:2-polyprenyl-3-methyl-5-hydroxy-6-metoxy-1,4-benzoquinol methylase
MKELYEDVYTSWFSFGKNREDFLKHVTPEQVELAKSYVQDFLWKHTAIAGKTVIDVGCGSWIMSLVYVLLGAKKVVSIDIDATSLACTETLREKYAISPDIWEIQSVSILDTTKIISLGTYDIVYSWWVIHHSWDMRQGLENLFSLAHNGSFVYIALYNTCTRFVEGTSYFWQKLKKIYSQHHWTRWVIKPLYTIYLLAGLVATGRNPWKYITGYKSIRGMNFFTDIEDRLGGYPYEFATYDEVVAYYQKHGYTCVDGIRVRSIGCNEFLFH